MENQKSISKEELIRVLTSKPNKKFIVLATKKKTFLVWSCESRSIKGYCKSCGSRVKLLKVKRFDKTFLRCPKCYKEAERPIAKEVKL